MKGNAEAVTFSTTVFFQQFVCVSSTWPWPPEQSQQRNVFPVCYLRTSLVCTEPWPQHHPTPSGWTGTPAEPHQRCHQNITDNWSKRYKHLPPIRRQTTTNFKVCTPNSDHGFCCLGWRFHSLCCSTAAEYKPTHLFVKTMSCGLNMLIDNY